LFDQFERHGDGHCISDADGIGHEETCVPNAPLAFFIDGIELTEDECHAETGKQNR
jgi:hypothetical protein